MTKDQSYYMNRLQYLFRQNLRRREIEKFSISFSKLFNAPVKDKNLVSLEESDRLQEKFISSFKAKGNLYCKQYASSNLQGLAFQINNLIGHFVEKTGYLLLSRAETYVFGNLPMDMLLKNFKEIIEIDGDSFYVLSSSEDEAVFIDFYEEHNTIGSSWQYEYSHWQL